MPQNGIEDTYVPLVEEKLFVTKRAVFTERVVLRKQTNEHDAIVEVPLHHDELDVERVPVGRVVADAPPVHEEGGVIIVPLVEEELVVTRRLVLREEVRIRRRRTITTETVTEQLRREEIVIERDHASASQHEKGADMSTSNNLNQPGIAPNTEHQIVAMFDTYAQARSAREALVSAGVPTSAIDLLDREGDVSDTNFTYERTDEGFWGAIKRLFVPEEDAPSYAEGVRRGHALLVVRPEGTQRERVIAVLEQQNPVDLDTRESEWRSSGWSGEGYGATGAAGSGAASLQATSAEPSTAYAAAPGGQGVTETGRSGEQVVPVVEETLRVGKRQVDSGNARVRSYVLERPVQEQVNLREEHVHVERRPVTEPASAVPADAFRERSVEVTATSEESVAAKEARVVEEVVVRKHVGERTETVSDTVRRTEVEVERDGKKVQGPGTTGQTSASPKV